MQPTKLTLWRFIASLPKSYRLNKGSGFNLLEFHVWRWYVLSVRDVLNPHRYDHKH